MDASSDEDNAIKEINTFISTVKDPKRQNLSKIDQHRPTVDNARTTSDDDKSGKQFTISMICTKFRSGITLIA